MKPKSLNAEPHVLFLELKYLSMQQNPSFEEFAMPQQGQKGCFPEPDGPIIATNCPCTSVGNQLVSGLEPAVYFWPYSLVTLLILRLAFTHLLLL